MPSHKNLVVFENISSCVASLSKAKSKAYYFSLDLFFPKTLLSCNMSAGSINITTYMLEWLNEKLLLSDQESSQFQISPLLVLCSKEVVILQQPENI
jgi:hypothetical protein